MSGVVASSPIDETMSLVARLDVTVSLPVAPVTVVVAPVAVVTAFAASVASSSVAPEFIAAV